jgi:mono/diheme cytochrome c family protein
MVRSAIVSGILVCLALAGSARGSEKQTLDAAEALGKLGVNEIIFAVRQVDGDGHWYANFSYNSKNPKRKYYHDGGRLCRLNVKTGKVVCLINDPKGGVRDPQMHYDGKKILFSYRKGGQPYYHLYEINIDGTGLQQITNEKYDDIEAIYLPDGDIVFCSSRSNRFVQCWFTRVANIYRCKGDGSQIRPLSCNLEQDNTPWLLPDGRILHQRWEYIDRSRVRFHHLWTMNPDGSNQAVYYGNMHPGTVMIDAKPIPGTLKVISSFSPGHGRKEHAGFMTIVDPRNGPDDRSMAKKINKDGSLRDPYAVSQNCFLVARDTDIRVIDAHGASGELYRLPKEWIVGAMKIHEPRPVRARKRERVIPSRVNLAMSTGTVTLQDVYIGRNMKGVKRGDIKELLIIEALPKPVNFSGTMEPITIGGSFTLERVLGTVPIEEDGSASFELPALRSIFFVALDENGLSVKRMQSFMAVQPGERLSCVGCHEERGKTAPPGIRSKAMRRPPSKIKPTIGPGIYDFPRDIQPILDKHCLRCHGPTKTDKGGPYAGKVLLDGGRGPMYSHSYSTLFKKGQISHGRDANGNIAPRGIGSSASKLMKLIDGDHYKVKLSSRERTLVRLWIDSAAVYPGTYAALGSGMVRSGVDAGAQKVFNERCGECHKSKGKKPVVKFDPELMFNLTDPEKSLVLTMPLNGMVRKVKKNGKTVDECVKVFKNTKDPGYQAILANVQKSKAALDKIKRFDMPGFRPNIHYLREMKVYGILPADFDIAKDPANPYEIDRKYWESFWHKPKVGASDGE